MKNEKVDLRTISTEKLKKIKIKAIKLRDDGTPNKEVAEKFNLDPSVLSRWYRDYVKNYRQSKEILKKGRKKGTHRKINNHQLPAVIKMLQEYDGLLDKELVKKMIEDKLGITIPLTTVGDYLKEWGISSNVIDDFKNDFGTKIDSKEFKLVKNKIRKQGKIFLWIAVLEREIEVNTIDKLNVLSVSTLAAKNKLVFKLYEKRLQVVNLIEFVNQIASLFMMHIYVILRTKDIKLIEDNNCLTDSAEITFIYDE